MSQNLSTPSQVGNILREKRKSQGLTQDELAKLMGVRRQTLADLELGKNVGSHLLFSVMTYLGLGFDLLAQSSHQKNVNQHPKSVREVAETDQLSDKFDFPYDWSNPGQLPDDVLIMKVLKRLHFEDIVRLCKRFGVERIDQEIKSDFYDDVRDDLLEMMEIIHEAYARKAAKYASN
jgi:transcriptional regulator with XRE-family HTH domain